MFEVTMSQVGLVRIERDYMGQMQYFLGGKRVTVQEYLERINQAIYEPSERKLRLVDASTK